MYNLNGLNILVVILAIWTIPWKGYALWLSAKRDQKKWFIVMLILNTVGILEIIYIFKVAKKSWADIKTDFHTTFSSTK